MESRREYWDRVGHKSACPVWGDEEMIETCTCGPARRKPKHTVLPLRPGSSREAVMNNYWVQAANADSALMDCFFPDDPNAFNPITVLKQLSKNRVQADNYYQGLTPTRPVGQVLVDEDYTDTELRVAAHYAQEEKDMATSQKQLEFRRARLERELERAEVELERIANLPEEPVVDSVVSFEKTYEVNGKNYSWVAYHAKQGCWYLSQDGLYGAREPKKTWFELLEFIGDNTIYLATAWEELA